jgi:sporadic carbohydrate cluster protein (TIGR04323 family)
LVEKADSYDGIVMCSVSMLPIDPRIRKSVVTRILEQGCKMHFTFENFVVAFPHQLTELEELFSLIDFSTNEQFLNHFLSPTQPKHRLGAKF